MKPMRVAHNLFVLAVLLCQFTALASVCCANAQELDCDKYLQIDTLYGLEKDEILHIQKQLDDSGYDHGSDDGIIGPQTITALAAYCDDVKGQVAAETTTNREAVSYMLTEEDLKALQQGDEMEAVHLPQSLITTLEPLQNIEYASADLFDNAVEQQAKALKVSDALYSGAEKAMVQRLAKQTHPIDDSVSIQWESNGCGCVQALTGTVYGFYPYWMASDKKDESTEKRTIDFSILSRIAYFALFMDQSGQLQTHSLWQQDQHKAAFIKKAHKYRTQVDLDVYNPDWRTWYQTATTDQSAMIVELVRLVSTSPQVDGVTLYFEKYPQNDTYAEAFKTFLDTLQVAIKRTGKPFFLNVMMPAIGKNNEATARKFLSHIFPDNRQGTASTDPVNLLIVFMEEPTTDTKKEMRYIIEKAFKGYQRKEVLRKIVPVIIPPQDPKDQQFADDLIYFENNFGGVAFWPLPTGDADELEQIATEVLSAFQPKDNPELVQQMLQNHTGKFCGWICPNRKILQKIFWALLLLLATFALGSSRICELRALQRKYLWVFLALIGLDIAILFSLLTCDPDWMNRSTEVFIALILVLTFYLIFRQVRKMRQAQYP